MLDTKCFICIKYETIHDDKQFFVTNNIEWHSRWLSCYFSAQNFFKNSSHVYNFVSYFADNGGNKLAFHFRISCSNEILCEQDLHHLDGIVQSV